MTCQIDGDFDYIFVKVQNVVSYAIAVDGTSHGTRTLPASVSIPNAYPAIPDVSIVRHGYQHDLYKLTNSLSGQTLTLMFTGNNIRVNEVFVLKLLTQIKQMEQVAHAKVDRDSIQEDNYVGYAETEIITGADRLRWVSDLNIEFPYQDENYEPFLDLIEDNDEIVFAQEPARKPHRVYRGIFPLNQYEAPYLCAGAKDGGNSVRFQIAESRAVGDLWYSLPTFNTNESGDGLMFFRNCKHLGENGAVDDNDYVTFSQEATYTLNVDGVSHVFLKATGVTSYQVQTLVGNVWTTQETVTPTQKAYRGWEHSLTKLTNRLTADQVRLVLAGSSITVCEIMALDRAGEILTESQTVSGKVARKQVVHESGTGGLQRTSVTGAQRMKWQVRCEASFGALDAFVSEDFIDWANLNPNFVFGYTPNDTPWRCYPATWGSKELSGRFLTKVLQQGDFVGFRVIER